MMGRQWDQLNRMLDDQLIDDPSLVEKARLWGYNEAVSDYGIWKDGVQTVGAMKVPIKEAIRLKAQELGLLKARETKS